jgi:dolichol-phosphate mannosyltransferase
MRAIKKADPMATLPRQLTRSPELTRFVRFLAVGALGTLLDFGLLTVLKMAGTPTLVANSLGFLAGLTSNYIWNSRWTFAGQTREGWRQFLQFACVSLVGLMLNNAIVLALESPLGRLIGDPARGYLPAKVLATGLVVFWNYFANRFWTFKSGTQI